MKIDPRQIDRLQDEDFDDDTFYGGRQKVRPQRTREEDAAKQAANARDYKAAARQKAATRYVTE